MSCTPEQIAEKQRQAQLKLARRRLLNSSFDGPLEPVQNDTKPKPYDKPKPSTSFYGDKKATPGSCCLISEERFAVNFPQFNVDVIEVFKTIPTKSYNPRTKIWDFHLKDYDLLQTKISRLKPKVFMEKLPSYVLKCCKFPKPNYLEMDLSPIDPELLGALMPFQQEGVCYGVDKNGRCLIADDMGLGKTFQALAIAHYYLSDWPVLIVTTASMKNTWEGTIHQYLPSISVLHIKYMVTARDYIGDEKILIVSHDMMSRAVNKLVECNFGVLIIDESHNIKNFKAKCTQAAMTLAKKATRVILLSGTPALSRPSELYSQLSLIDEHFFGNFLNYSKRYCDGKSTNFGWDASGKSNLQELEIVLNKKFMIRRTKEEVLRDLPNKTQEVVTLDVNFAQFSEEDRKCLNALAAKYSSQKRGNEKHAALLTFFAETAKIKVPCVCSYILQVLKETKKFIVFAHHQVMVNAVAQLLTKKDRKFIRIDGNTTTDQRKHFVDKFQLDPAYECALLSITAANAGITLTASQLVIFAELHWNPSILSQAESRAHRIGQEGQVVIRYLLAPGTADDSIWPLLQNKQKILKEIGLAKESFENVAVTKQTGTSVVDSLSSKFTGANTLDISSYFQSQEDLEWDKTISKNKENSEEMDCFDDGCDELLSNIPLNL